MTSSQREVLRGQIAQHVSKHQSTQPGAASPTALELSPAASVTHAAHAYVRQPSYQEHLARVFPSVNGQTLWIAMTQEQTWEVRWETLRVHLHHTFLATMQSTQRPLSPSDLVYLGQKFPSDPISIDQFISFWSWFEPCMWMIHKARSMWLWVRPPPAPILIPGCVSFRYN